MLRAPFPWFGGKSKAAKHVWPRLGDVANYIEPFAGSLAVLLARPTEARVETVNDRDAYLSNFWRALQQDPAGVARHADWPVNEADLHARHRWLVDTARERVEQLRSDPDFYDPKVAGWWVWGQCLWIGSGWCAEPGWTGRVNAGRSARGIHTAQYAQRPDLSAANGRGLGKRPYLGGKGVGVGLNARRVWQKRPALMAPHGRGVLRRPNMGGQGGGQGVHAPRLTKQIPQLSGDGSGVQRGCLALESAGLHEYMLALATRLRRVRVCCGDWKRVVTHSVTSYIGVTGILLDPPYSQAERSICYSHDEDVSAEVRVWALEHGDDPRLRIALCGYEGEHEMPATWECVAWKAQGGYARSVRGRANRHRERIWFSPHCLPAERSPLFTIIESNDRRGGSLEVAC